MYISIFDTVTIRTKNSSDQHKKTFSVVPVPGKSVIPRKRYPQRGTCDLKRTFAQESNAGKSSRALRLRYLGELFTGVLHANTLLKRVLLGLRDKAH